MRTNLKVPFAEKDEAKRLGAKWDAAGKVWYVVNVDDLSVFLKWLPSDSDAVAGATSARSATTRASGKDAGIVVIGPDYVEQPRVCDCLPWAVCDKCRDTALGV